MADQNDEAARKADFNRLRDLKARREASCSHIRVTKATTSSGVVEAFCQDCGKDLTGTHGPAR